MKNSQFIKLTSHQDNEFYVNTAHILSISHDYEDPESPAAYLFLTGRAKPTHCKQTPEQVLALIAES